MDVGTRRSVLQVQVLIETTDSTQEEHDRTVEWAANRLKLAPSRIRNGFVATKVGLRDGQHMGMSTYGQKPSDETREIENDFFDVSAG